MMRHNRVRAHKVLVAALAYLQGEDWVIRFLEDPLVAVTGTGLRALDALEAPREYVASLDGYKVAVYLSEPFDNVLVEVRGSDCNRVYVVADELGVTGCRVGVLRAWELANALADVADRIRGYPGAQILWEVVARLREV